MWRSMDSVPGSLAAAPRPITALVSRGGGRNAGCSVGMLSWRFGHLALPPSRHRPAATDTAIGRRRYVPVTGLSMIRLRSGEGSGTPGWLPLAGGRQSRTLARVLDRQQSAEADQADLPDPVLIDGDALLVREHILAGDVDRVRDRCLVRSSQRDVGDLGRCARR